MLRGVLLQDQSKYIHGGSDWFTYAADQRSLDVHKKM